MGRLPNFRGYNERLSFEMGEASGQVRSLSALHEWAERYLARLCQADHVALCRVHPVRVISQPQEALPLREDWSERLTPKQRQLANLFLSQGGSNQDLARELGIQEETVKTHWKQIREATGAEDRVDFMNRGRRTG